MKRPLSRSCRPEQRRRRETALRATSCSEPRALVRLTDCRFRLRLSHKPSGLLTSCALTTRCRSRGPRATACHREQPSSSTGRRAPCRVLWSPWLLIHSHDRIHVFGAGELACAWAMCGSSRPALTAAWRKRSRSSALRRRKSRNGSEPCPRHRPDRRQPLGADLVAGLARRGLEGVAWSERMNHGRSGHSGRLRRRGPSRRMHRVEISKGSTSSARCSSSTSRRRRSLNEESGGRPSGRD
jgi:hypothetical protein